MEVNLIKIGNSKGLIIPSRLLKIIGLKEKVNIEVQDQRIIITPVEKLVREGWEDAIKAEIERKGQPERLMPDFFEDEQENEWEW